jgi:hypothetical protein
MPRRHVDLFDGFASFAALHAAAKKAVLGKRRKPGAAAFFANLERKLLTLERELQSGSYRPGRYVGIRIKDPKAPCRRVVRGGAWNNNPRNLRSACRNRNTTDNRNNNQGFRLARTCFAGAVGIMVPAGVHLTFRVVHDEHGRVRGGARYHGGACPGRHTGSDRRRRLLIPAFPRLSATAYAAP